MPFWWTIRIITEGFLCGCSKEGSPLKTPRTLREGFNLSHYQAPEVATTNTIYEVTRCPVLIRVISWLGITSPPARLASAVIYSGLIMSQVFSFYLGPMLGSEVLRDHTWPRLWAKVMPPLIGLLQTPPLIRAQVYDLVIAFLDLKPDRIVFPLLAPALHAILPGR